MGHTEQQALEMARASNALARNICDIVVDKAQEMHLTNPDIVLFSSMTLAQCVTAIFAGALKEDRINSPAFDYLLGRFNEMLQNCASDLKQSATPHSDNNSASTPTDHWQ